MPDKLRFGGLAPQLVVELEAQLTAECFRDQIDNPAWEQERHIHLLEQAREQSGLAVYVNPLLGTVDCLFRFSNGDVESYTLECVASTAGNYLQWWQSKNGKYAAVNDDCTPFDYATLVAALAIAPDADPFLACLRREPLRWLAALGYSLDRIIPLTRFRYDYYPLVDWLIVASASHSCVSRFVNDRSVIDHALLATCLSVPELTYGQRSALLKLKEDEFPGAGKNLMRAVYIIAKRWEIVEALVADEPEITAHKLLFQYAMTSYDNSLG